MNLSESPLGSWSDIFINKLIELHRKHELIHTCEIIKKLSAITKVLLKTKIHWIHENNSYYIASPESYIKWTQLYSALICLWFPLTHTWIKDLKSTIEQYYIESFFL
jgi:hypothetical protein